MKKTKHAVQLFSLILTICIVLSFTTMAFAASTTAETRWDNVTVNKAGEYYCLTNDTLNCFEKYPCIPVMQVFNSYIEAAPETATDWAIPLRAGIQYTFGYSVDYNSATDVITVNNVPVTPVSVNGVNYLTLTECNNKISGFYAQARTLQGDTPGDVYLTFYQYSGTAHGTLTDEEIISAYEYLESFNIDEFYVNYNGQRESSYTTQAVIDVDQIAGQYPQLVTWKTEKNGAPYTALLGSFNDNIPVIEIAKDDNMVNKPVVIVQHALGGMKQSYLNFMGKLAEEGYRVISIDAYAHGERQANSQASPITTLQVAARLTIDWDAVLDYYKTLPNVNLKNFAMAGFSMGGLAAYNQLAFGRYKPCVIVPIVSTPDWKSIVDVSEFGNEPYSDAFYIRYNSPLTGNMPSPEELSTLMLLNNTDGKSLSPMDTIIHSVDWENTAILALYSDNDKIMPDTGIVTLQNSLPSGALYMFGNMRTGHYVSWADQLSAVNFIQAHLPVNRNLADITLKLGSNTCVAFDNVFTADGIQPVLSDEGQVVLPIRSGVTDALGYTASYNNETGNVELTNNNGTVTVIPESDLVYVNQRSYLSVSNYGNYLDVQIKTVVDDGRVYIVIYKDSYQYAVLNDKKAAIYVNQYHELAE